jgi:hypothetical protein
VGLVVARVAVGAALLTFFVAAALLVDIVVTYRESPMYDAFELAAIAIARPVRGDVARALPLAFSEQRTADENPSGRRWFRSWTQDDEGEHPRVAQSSVAIVTKAVGLGVFGVVVVAWLVRVVSQNAGGRWSDTLSRLFD